MPLAELLSADRIVILVEPVDRERVLDAAARLLAGASAEAIPTIAESLRQRERLGSTAIGHGVAIPHGRTDAFKEARAAFLRLAPGVDFDAADGQPVDLVFAMAVPAHFTQQHLQLLSELAERFSTPAFRTLLRMAPDAETLRGALLGAMSPAA